MSAGDRAVRAEIDTLLGLMRPPAGGEEQRDRDALGAFLEQVARSGQVIPKKVVATINHWIAEIDKKLSAQVNAILHHPAFQRLEGTWRGLHYLVDHSATGGDLKIRVLNCTERDLFKDLERAVEFDQSHLFNKVYEREYGVGGGQPYGLLLGDFAFGKTAEDIFLLKMVSGVAATAHAPFVAAASPKLFGFDRFTDLHKPRDLAKIFDTADYAAWQSFRESEDARYVALTLPRVLARLPYGSHFNKVDAFDYEEMADGTDHDRYCWMSAAWAYGGRVTDAYAKYGWLGATRGVENGGKVEDLPVHTFPTDDGGVALRCSTEVAISDRREFELSNLGFLPLLHCKDRDFVAFLGAQSCQKPKVYEGIKGAAATANAALSAKIIYILCVARFIHTLKVMARDAVGPIRGVKDVNTWLNSWITGYVPTKEWPSDEEMARRPLAEARVEVREVKGNPGRYEMVVYLRPNFQLECMTTRIRLVAAVPGRPRWADLA